MKKSFFEVGLLCAVNIVFSCAIILLFYNLFPSKRDALFVYGVFYIFIIRLLFNFVLLPILGYDSLKLTEHLKIICWLVLFDSPTFIAQRFSFEYSQLFIFFALIGYCLCYLLSVIWLYLKKLPCFFKTLSEKHSV